MNTSDLRAALRLVNEARDLPQGSPQQREYVLRSLAALTHAQVGVWAEVERGRILPAIDFGWSGERERAVFDEYLKGRVHLADPSLPEMVKRLPTPVVVAARHDLVGDREWYGSAHVQELRRPARVDAFLYAGWQDGSRMSALALHRAWGDKPFGERERALVEAICLECSFLRAPLLPPRLSEVLTLLSRGLSEKQIAAELSLSAHTVHDYVKALHRRFGVRSRGELLAAALRG
ncbi:MAG TPA: helix-turn-helix transcriptional regulator [Myxococcales bacterium]|jgi:DNA-binding CsgD family transcriptional regulator|nr:helix-turn-helix transcriptional regulator [Myxococcales bacterium]